MEDINNKLCELLNISKKQHWMGALGLHLWTHKIVDKNGNETKKVNIYPNLSNPNNFVQIMKIFHQEVNFSTGLSDNPVQSFLEVYLSVIQNNKDKDMVKRIKHFAQLVKWEY